MQNDVPRGSSGRGDGVRPTFKIVAVLSLVLLGYSVIRFAMRKPAVPGEAVITEHSLPEPRPDRERWMQPARSPGPGRVDARPAVGRTAASSNQRDESMASNLLAPEALAGSKKIIWRRLPTLQMDADGMVAAHFETPVFYDVADRYAGELRIDYTQIANATNILKQYDADFRALRAGIETDREDYLRQVKAADERRQNEYAAAMKRQIDLQALYLERKQQFQASHQRRRKGET